MIMKLLIQTIAGILIWQAIDYKRPKESMQKIFTLGWWVQVSLVVSSFVLTIIQQSIK